MLAASFTSRGVPVEIEVRAAEPARAILAAAEEHGVALITVGTHGRKGIARMLVGSVAEQVVRNATCPVITIRGLDVLEHPSHVQAQVGAEADG